MLTVFAIVATIVIVTLLSTGEDQHEEFPLNAIGTGFNSVISGVKGIGRRGGSAGKNAAKGADDAPPVVVDRKGSTDALAPGIIAGEEAVAKGPRNIISSGLNQAGRGAKWAGKSIKKNPLEFISIALTIPFLATMFSPAGSQEGTEGDQGGPGPNQLVSLLSVVSSSCFCFFCVSMLIAASSASSLPSA